MRERLIKRLTDVTIADLEAFPVWDFTAEPETSLCIQPVECLPVADLRNRVVGTKVTLHSGKKYWAILGNIDLSNEAATEHFLTLSIEKCGRWFDLARYHDVDYQQRGPRQLAEFLGLPLTSVFPIKYDLSFCVCSDSPSTKGVIPLEPREKLPQDVLIRLALGTE